MAKLPDNSSFIPNGLLPLTIGRGRDCDLRLTDPSVSTKHAVLERSEENLIVKDLGSRFGTHVNGVTVRQRTLKIGDYLRFGQLVTYEVIASGLSRVEAGGIDLVLSDLRIEAAGQTLVSLEGFTWTISPGRVTGILGPSGSGKSMLLRSLAGIRSLASGMIRCSELPEIQEDINYYRRLVAYIPQDDVVYPVLTIRENLEFTAELRLAHMVDKQEQKQRVEAALDLFGLSPHAEKLVTMLSGGQRKRLSVAMEWVRKPKVMFLDEPTAGLDPANEARLMQQLVQASRRGTTVVCTTHLMANLYLLDEILVLGMSKRVGVPAYCGQPQHLLESLNCRHFSDLYEKLEKGDFIPLSRAPVTSDLSPASENEVSPSPSRVGASDRLRGVPLRQLAIPPEHEVDLTSVAVIIRRSFLNLWRDRWMRWMIIAQPVVLAVVISLTQFSPGRLAGLFFFITIVACWLGMNNSIRDLVRDRRNYIRDRLAGMSSTSYLLGKWLTYGAIGVAQLLVFLVVIKLITPFILPEALHPDFQEQSGVLWFCGLYIIYLAGLGLAFAVSTIVSTEDAAIAWLPILILPQILLSGMATNVTSLKYTDARPFRPIVVTMLYPFSAAQPVSTHEEPDKLRAFEVLIDGISLFLVCRPGMLVIERPQVRGFSQFLWLADLCHLLLFLITNAMVSWILFLRRERHWPALIGY
ncbi:MAG: ATP-binding cassette domain-containing protein [Gemmatales bacterium]|nr:ATP-binding cassette domain-containing protein [Gemmatales bacterium]